VALEDFAYTLDDDGRLTSSQSAVNHTLVPASAASGTFDANNRPTQFNGNALSFDDLGELVSNIVGQTSTTYQWDGRGRLTGAHLPNGTTVQYSYDAMNRLASRSDANKIGDILVTNLEADASSSALSQIGIEEARQQFAIQMSRETLLNNGISPGLTTLNNVFTIPGNTILQGVFSFTRLF
jgi:YD repeat-containing protein